MTAGEGGGVARARFPHCTAQHCGGRGSIQSGRLSEMTTAVVPMYLFARAGGECCH